MDSKMDSEKDKEKLFSEQIDRLLAGQESKTDQQIGDDLRSALDFAQKMAALRPQPSARFESILKDRLLRRLEEQEAGKAVKEKQGWFNWLRQPAWQAATALLVILIILGAAWAAGVFNPREPVIVSVPTTVPAATTTRPAATTSTATAPAATTPATTQPATVKPTATSAPTTIPGILLQAEGNTNKPAYVSGEDVKIEITLRNVSSQPLSIEQFPPILSLMQAETRQPVYTFRAGTDSRTLAPNATATYAVNWNQLDFKGQPVPYGGYYLELEDLDSQGQAIQLNFTRTVSFIILPG